MHTRTRRRPADPAWAPLRALEPGDLDRVRAALSDGRGRTMRTLAGDAGVPVRAVSAMVQTGLLVQRRLHEEPVALPACRRCAGPATGADLCDPCRARLALPLALLMAREAAREREPAGVRAA